MWHMRSNDLWLGTPYDAFNFARLTSCVAGELAVPAGEVVLFAGSSHLYEKDFNAAMAVLERYELGWSHDQPELPGFPPSYISDMRGYFAEPWARYVDALKAPNKREALSALTR